MFYHIVELKRVFEIFNCINQIKNLIFLNQNVIFKSSFLIDQFLSIFIH